MAIISNLSVKKTINKEQPLSVVFRYKEVFGSIPFKTSEKIQRLWEIMGPFDFESCLKVF